MSQTVIYILQHFNTLFYSTAFVAIILILPLIEIDTMEPIRRYSRSKKQSSIFSSIVLIVCWIAFGVLLVRSTTSMTTYYDFFSTRLVLFATFFLLMGVCGLAFCIQLLREGAVFIAIVMLFSGLFGLSFPLMDDTKKDITALLVEPHSASGIVQSLNAVYRRYEIRYMGIIDEKKYRIQPKWHSQLHKGEHITFVHDCHETQELALSQVS